MDLSARRPEDIPWSEIWSDIVELAKEKLPEPVTRSAASFVGTCVVLTVLLGGCVALLNQALNPPSTRVELCSAYRDFSQEWFSFSFDDDLFDNEAFDEMEHLADVAKRYPDNPAVRADGEALDDLADGGGGFVVSVSLSSADRASRNINAECR